VFSQVVNVLEVGATFRNACPRFFFLDVGMEGIEQIPPADGGLLRTAPRRLRRYSGSKYSKRFSGSMATSTHVTLEHGPELLITLHSPIPFVGGSAPPWQVSHGEYSGPAIRPAPRRQSPHVSLQCESVSAAEPRRPLK